LKKTIYLASPYGFSEQIKEKCLPDFIAIFEKLGLEVWEPFTRNGQVDLSKKDWAYQVAKSDFEDVKNCDAFFAIVNGNPPDEGVMVELGAAFAWGKPVFLFRDDFRRCTDSEIYPLNLMLFAGLDPENWKLHYYESLQDLTNPDKALVKWARDEVAVKT